MNRVIYNRYVAMAFAVLVSLAAPTAQAVPLQVRQSGLSTSLAPAVGFEEFGQVTDDRSFHPDILYAEVMLSYGPLQDPRPIFLLVNAYLTANQQAHGIRFFEKLLIQYEQVMPPQTRAIYLSATAILRATYADQVFILKRIPWVLDTFELLDQARQLSGGTNPLVRWSSGLIYAQVPWFFGKQEDALKDLNWLVDHPELEPEPGFYREAYRHLSLIYTDKGEDQKAERYLIKSGYQAYQPKSLFMGWFATSEKKGLLFAPTPALVEIIPGRVFAVRGFGFSELHFVVSDDGKNLIAIDAGTQPFSMEAGYTYLTEQIPNLPPMTTAFITHAHWDHIGGYTYLKTLNPEITLYGRENYQTTLQHIQRNPTYKQFRSTAYRAEWTQDYKPDVGVSEKVDVVIGGTTFELVPVVGGETDDALLIHMPDLKVLFAGDVVMPFYGEPWVEEGHIDDALDSMDEIISRHPTHILHGHYGLNYLYSADKLKAYRDAFAWLVKETRRHLKNGYSVKEIVRLNLIPPLLKDAPQAIVSFQSPRDHIIARIGDHMLGIWQEDSTGQQPQGLDILTAVEYGRLLQRYFGLSITDVETGLRAMIDGGDNELALQMAVAAEARYENTSGIQKLKEEAADRLRSAVQFLDPFRFTVYTELIGKEHGEIPPHGK